jgi:hypothetical protein
VPSLATFIDADAQHPAKEIFSFAFASRRASWLDNLNVPALEVKE